jgi:alkanesulfonate monooxygenase SsuD/methylene tetrahydromethanopterin reductase-like flavin-dependent oxidoreductase (luciferase family)
MILSAFFFNPQGDHRMSWRHPDAPGRDILDLSYNRRLAEAAESARMDAIFVADHVAMWDTYESNIAHYANARLEPITMLAALAAVTRNIGYSLSSHALAGASRARDVRRTAGRGPFAWA